MFDGVQQSLLPQKKCQEIFKKSGLSNGNSKKCYSKAKKLVASAGGAGAKTVSVMNKIEFFAALRECVLLEGRFQEFADNPLGPADYSDSEGEEVVEGFGAGTGVGAGADATDGGVYVGGSAPLFTPPEAGNDGIAIRRKASLLGGNFGGNVNRGNPGGGGGDGGGEIVVSLERETKQTSWGFALGDTADGSKTVSFVKDGGLCDGKLLVSDVILAINRRPTAGLSHSDVVSLIVDGNVLELVVQRRGGASSGAAQTQTAAPTEPTMSFAERQEEERQAASAAFRQSLDLGRSPDRGGGAGGGSGAKAGGSTTWSSRAGGAAGMVAPAPPEYDIVLSYSVADSEMVDNLEQTLSAAGLRVWRMSEDGNAAGMFQRSAGWAIPSARCFLPIISSAFGHDDACLEDLSLAHILDKPVVAFSLVSFDDLKIDFYSRMKLSSTSIIYATSKNLQQAYAELGSSLALVEAYWADAKRFNPVHKHAYHRTAWSPVPVPAMAKLPWWTATFGHVEEVPWQQFIDSVFSSLPILQSIPNPLDLEKVLARVFPPFGPETPETVTRPMLLAELGIEVDAVLETVAQQIISLFLLLISAEIAFGPSSQLRVTSIDAVIDSGNVRQATLATAALASISQAWDPNLRLAGIASLTKIHSRNPKTAPPRVVVAAVLDMLTHDSSAVRAAASRAAGTLQVQQAKDTLEDIVLNDFDVVSRDAAEHALRCINGVWSGPLIAL